MDDASDDNFRKSAPVDSRGTLIETRGDDGEEVRDRYSVKDMVMEAILLLCGGRSCAWQTNPLLTVQ